MKRSALTGLRLGRREDAVSLLKSLWQETRSPVRCAAGRWTISIKSQEKQLRLGLHGLRRAV